MTLVDRDVVLFVCQLEDLLPDRGVCLLVADTPVALFRCGDDDLYAIGNVDPFTGASVMSRGLTGTTELDGQHVPFVASPLLKHRFDLRTGFSLDNPEIGLGSWTVRATPEGSVIVSASPG